MDQTEPGWVKSPNRRRQARPTEKPEVVNLTAGEGREREQSDGNSPTRDHPQIRGLGEA